MSRVWVSQPQVPVSVDWSNPLTKGLIGVYTPNGKSSVFTENAVYRGVNQKGVCVGYSSTRPPISSNYSLSGDRTVLLVASRKAVGTKVYFTTSSGGAVGYWIGKNASNANWSIGGLINDPKIVVIGRIDAVAATKSSTLHTLYVNGAYANSGTNSLADGTGISVASFGTDSGYDVSSSEGEINAVFVFSRALSPQEIKSLSDNPWQIFQPLPSRIFVGPAAATGNVTLDPYVGSVIITGYVPTFGGSQTIAGVKGSVTLTGYVATLDQDVSISGVKGSVTLTGYLPTIAQPHIVTGIKGSVTATGYTPTLEQDQAITAVKGSVTATGYVPTLGQDVALSPTKGSISVTGFIPDWSQTASGTLVPSRGSVTITGYAPALEQDITLSGIKGAVVISGYAPAVVQEYVVNPLTGAVVLTGNQPSVTQGADTVITPATANAILSGYTPTITQVAPTIARPSSDLTGTWSASDGGANKYAMIDEAVMDNADYIYTNTLGAKQRMTLSAVADPGTTAGQVFSYAVWSPSSNGIKVRLLNRDDDSVIAEWIHNGPLPTTPTTIPTDQSLTPTQIAAIHSYSGIDLEVEAIT